MATWKKDIDEFEINIDKMIEALPAEPENTKIVKPNHKHLGLQTVEVLKEIGKLIGENREVMEPLIPVDNNHRNVSRQTF